jgi:hypothetical protein
MMSAGDPFLREVGLQVVFDVLKDPAAILYRQQILIDAMTHPDVIRELYSLAVEAIEREKRVWGFMTTKYPNELLHRSVEVLEIFAAMLTRLRQIADERKSGFSRKDSSASSRCCRAGLTMTTSAGSGIIWSGLGFAAAF